MPLDTLLLPHYSELLLPSNLEHSIHSKSHIQSRLTTAGTSGDLSTLPDIFLMQDHAFQKNVLSYPDVFTEISEKKIDFSEFASGKTDFSVVDGKHYGVPFDNGATSLFNIEPVYSSQLFTSCNTPESFILQYVSIVFFKVSFFAIFKGATNYSNIGGSSWAISGNCGNVELAEDFLASTFAGSTPESFILQYVSIVFFKVSFFAIFVVPSSLNKDVLLVKQIFLL